MTAPKKIHIISFDVPYPPNYGGVIDVFYKLKALKSRGVSVIFHCFEYGRGEQRVLNDFCEHVYYYPRSKSWYQLFSFLPFIVRTRTSRELKENLLKDDFPVLFEGLHTCFLLSDPDLRKRKKIFRESNIEHEYYLELSRQENNWWKKFFFWQESIKLRWFESRLKFADLMFIVSETETVYFRNKFPNRKVDYLPSFHGNTEVKSRQGKGNYILFHGKLSVPENHFAAMQLIENVFSKITFPVFIAGMDPRQELIDRAHQSSNIRLVSNPTQFEMQELIEEAQVHCLYSEQATGLKLKLLNVLFNGRFILLNDKILDGITYSSSVIHLFESFNDCKEKINQLMQFNFSEREINERRSSLSVFDEDLNTEKMIRWIWNES